MKIFPFLSATFFFGIVFSFCAFAQNPAGKWENSVRERVELLSGTEWMAEGRIPRLSKNPDAVFPEAKPMKGMPYSQNTLARTLIGADVSVYTFISAKHNPASALYKINFRKPPYNKEKAATYYGVHCASCVSFAWGLPANVSVGQFYKGLGEYCTVAGNEIDSVRLYDAIAYQKGNHIRMAYDIVRDSSGRVQQIQFFEGWPPTAKLKWFTREQIKKLFINNEARIIRPNPEVIEGYYFPEYLNWSHDKYLCPEDICLFEGDRKTYKETDSIRINILSDRYRNIVLVRDGETVSSEKVDSRKEVVFTSLAPGLYEVFMVKGKKHSDTTRFDVIDTTCVVRQIKNRVEVTPSGEGVRPVFVKFRLSKLDAPAFFGKEGSGKTRTAQFGHKENKPILIGLSGLYSTVTCRIQ